MGKTQVRKQARKTDQTGAQHEDIHIGDIAIDTGRLLMADPCRVDEVVEKLEVIDGNDVVNIRKDFSPTVNMGIGLVLPTGVGDGIYPVIAHYETTKQYGRRIAGLSITFGNPLRGFGCPNKKPHKFAEQCLFGSQPIEQVEFLGHVSAKEAA